MTASLLVFGHFRQATEINFQVSLLMLHSLAFLMDTEIFDVWSTANGKKKCSGFTILTRLLLMCLNCYQCR